MQTRLVAESPWIEIKLKPTVRMVNPVFELEAARPALAEVSLDGKALARDGYAWDGQTLWVKAVIDTAGATLRLRFQ